MSGLKRKVEVAPTTENLAHPSAEEAQEVPGGIASRALDVERGARDGTWLGPDPTGHGRIRGAAVKNGQEAAHSHQLARRNS